MSDKVASASARDRHHYTLAINGEDKFELGPCGLEKALQALTNNLRERFIHGETFLTNVYNKHAAEAGEWVEGVRTEKVTMLCCGRACCTTTETFDVCLYRRIPR